MKNMKLFTITSCFAVMIFCQAGSVKAETGGAEQTSYELNHKILETKRQAVVAANIPFSSSEAKKFWPLYLDYRSAVKEVDDGRGELIRRLADNYDSLADGEGKKMVNDALKLEKKRQAIKERYMKKFARVLASDRLFRFYQVETKLDAIHRHAWTSQIPLTPVSQ